MDALGRHPNAGAVVLMPVLAFVMGNWKLILLGLLLATIGVQTFRLDMCKSGRHKDKVSAEAERVHLSALLQAQEQAVSDIVKESEERRAAGKMGLQKATTETQAARNEAQRLRGLASTPRSSGASQCAAADAVSEIRKGLAK